MSNLVKKLAIVLTVLFGVGVLGFLAIQLIPVDRTNPPVVREPNWNSPQTRALVKRACFDCHSNETVWPWYTNVAPVSWLAAHDVQEGRAALNYSEWQPNQENEAVEAVLAGKMPMPIYLAIHPEARLTQAETQALIAGLEATFGPGEGENNEAGHEAAGGQHQEKNEHQGNQRGDD